MRLTTNPVNITSVTACIIVACLSAIPPASAGIQSAASLYRNAQTAEKNLHTSKKRISQRSEWTKVAKMYHRVVLANPQSSYCDDALYFEAEIYLEIDRRFKNSSARQRALDRYLLLANGYPSSKWAKKARLNRGKLYLEVNDLKSARIELRKTTATWPNTSEGTEAKRLLANMATAQKRSLSSTSQGLVQVHNIRHWSDSRREYTRVVIDMDKDITYRQEQLESPQRIYFDLLGATITKTLAQKDFPVKGDFLRRIRVGQNTPTTVRVVLDFKNVSDYNVFWLPDPYRLVIDISGEKPRETSVSNRSTNADNLAPRSTTEPLENPEDLRLTPPPRDDGQSIYQQLGLEPRRILIDPGHGGHDPGTTSRKGLREKDLVLDISKRVAELLRSNTFEVLMTRDSDIFIPLEERTAIANSKGADLFVSIHINASRSTRPRGTETYFLNLTTDPDAAEVAARENASSTRRLSELNNLLQKVMNNSKITESRELATQIQDAMASTLLPSKNDVRNRGVKKAPFYVLLGAQMPAVLVEVAYLSNQKDEALLNDPNYRQKVAESIAKGINTYHTTLARTAKMILVPPTSMN